jgi:hypothetical protein
MSVKRLKLVDEFHAAVSRRLKELFRELDHAKHSNFKDILNHLDYSQGGEGVVGESHTKSGSNKKKE